ncbi:MAG: hypothetical protein RSA02_03680 [Bacteroidales bacterium]
MLKISRGIENWTPVNNPIVTVGSFDGVHLAHRSIIALLNHYAEMCRGESVLVTFSPHPRLILPTKDEFRKNFRLLTTEEEKEYLLEKAGLKNILVVRFDEKFSALSSQNFIKKILVDTLQVRHMVVGYNHNFGHDRHGSYEQMQEFGRLYDFEVDKYPELLVQNEHVSSSCIRNFIREGRLSEANNLLGYEYFIHGNWHQNIFEPNSKFKLLPALGHYLTRVKVKGIYHYAVCDINEEICFPDLQFLEEGDAMKINFIREINW